MRSTGEVYTWGQNQNGQLGHGDKKIRSLPCLCLQFRGRRCQHISAGATHSVCITAKASTVFGKPATIAWPGGVDNETGNRYRASAMDIWLPHNRLGSVPTHGFSGLQDPIFTASDDTPRSKLPKIIVPGYVSDTYRRTFPLRKSSSSEPTFGVRDIWLPMKSLKDIDSTNKKKDKKRHSSQKRLEATYVNYRDKRWIEDRDQIFVYKQQRVKAAVVIQKWARRFFVENKRWYKNRDNMAANNIQRIFRGRKGRKNVKARSMLIVKAQAYARGFLTRKTGTVVQIASRRFLNDNAALKIQMLIRRRQAKKKVKKVRKEQFEKDIQLYIAASIGDLNAVVKAFEAGSRTTGYFDNNDLDSLGVAKEKGFTLVCDWLSAEEVEERKLIFREWLESDERKELKMNKGVEPKSDGNVM